MTVLYINQVKLYYYTKVMNLKEENVNEVLGVESQESQVSQEGESVEKVVIDYDAENMLHNIARIILVVGILATCVCFFCLSFYRVSSYGAVYHDEFNPTGFGYTLEVFFGTLALWAFLRVFVNISKTLKEINSKLK